MRIDARNSRATVVYTRRCIELKTRLCVFMVIGVVSSVPVARTIEVTASQWRRQPHVASSPPLVDINAHSDSTTAATAAAVASVVVRRAAVDAMASAATPTASAASDRAAAELSLAATAALEATAAVSLAFAASDAAAEANRNEVSEV